MVDACRTQRPVSTARSRALASDWEGTTEVLYDDASVGFVTMRPPARTPSRTSSLKYTSNDVTTAMSPSEVESKPGPSPAMASREISDRSAIGSTTLRSGTYSPKGTRCALS